MLLKENSTRQQAPEGKTGARPKSGVAAPSNGLARWIGRVLVAMSLVLIMALWWARGTSKTAQSIAAAQHSSVLLIDEVEQLPSLAWKAVPFSLRHQGLVNIDVQVVRGNRVDVFLTGSHQIDEAKNVDWNNLKVYGDISAARTKAFNKGVRLGPGGFYLVVRDMTIGTPSSRPSEISVKVRLTP